MEYIVYQTIIVSHEKFFNHGITTVDTIVRRVYANSKAEAIGKFILETKDITAEKRLDVFCVELQNLKTIK